MIEFFDTSFFVIHSDNWDKIQCITNIYFVKVISIYFSTPSIAQTITMMARLQYCSWK